MVEMTECPSCGISASIRMTVHTTGEPVLCIHGPIIEVKPFESEEEAIAYAHGYAAGAGRPLELIES